MNEVLVIRATVVVFCLGWIFLDKGSSGPKAAVAVALLALAMQ